MKDKRKPTYEELKQRLAEADSIIAGLRRNVTENNQELKSLPPHDAFFRATLDSTDDGILAVDKNGKVVYSNIRFAEMWRIPSELVQRGEDDALLAYVLDQLVEPEAFLSKVKQLYKYDQSLYDILRFKDGRIFERYSTPLKLNNAIAGRVWSFRDITERKKAENALLESEEFVSSLLENAPHATVVVNPDTSIRYVNPAWEHLNGWTLSEVVGLKVPYPWWPEERKEEFLNGFMEAMQQSGGKTQVIGIKKNGEYYWIDLNWVPVTHNGKLQYLIINSIDITERRNLQEKLERQYHESRLIIDSSPLLIFYKDKEGKFLRVNKAFATALNIPEAQFIGKTVFDLYSARIAQGMTNDDRDVLGSGKPKLNIIEQYESASGLRWVQTDKVPILDNDGKTIALIGFAQDITERKQAEEELKTISARQEAILASVPDIIMEVDKNKVYTWANQAGLEFFGDDVLGKEAAFYFEGEQDTYKVVAPLFNGDENMIYVESWQRRKDGARRLLAWWCRVLKDKDGNIIGALSTARDITRRVEAIEELRESEEKFAKAFNTSPNLMAISSFPEGRIIDINDVYCHVTGYTREELIGHTAKEHNMWLNLEQRTEFYRRFQDKTSVEDVEVLLRTKSGNIRTLLFSAAKITLHGQPCLVTAARDITELKKAEVALADEVTWRRILINQSRDGIVILDQDGKVHEANQSFARMLGYSMEEIQQLHVWDWGFRLPREQIQEVLRTVDETGDHFETQHRRKDGTLFDVEISTNGAYFAG